MITSALRVESLLPIVARPVRSSGAISQRAP